MDADAPIELDLRGLKCPMPVLRTRKAMRKLAAGRSLRVSVHRSAAAIDIPNMAREDGHRLVASSTDADATSFLLVKSRD